MGCSDPLRSVVERRDVGTVEVTVCYLDVVCHVRERNFYHAGGDCSAAYGMGGVGIAGRGTPSMTVRSAAGQAG